MHIVHVVMAAAAALLGMVAIIAVDGRREQRLVTIVACAALVVGHVASLLPAAPEWYAVGVVFASIAGFGWIVWTISAALASRRIAVGRPEPSAGGERPALRVVNATVVGDKALSAAPARSSSGDVVSIIRDEPVRHVTRAQLLAAGPGGAERVTGPTYVAANLVDYVQPGSGSSIARAHRRTAARAAPAAPTRTVSPEQRLRTLQLRAAYAQQGPQAAAHDLRA